MTELRRGDVVRVFHFDPERNVVAFPEFGGKPVLVTSVRDLGDGISGVSVRLPNGDRVAFNDKGTHISCQSRWRRVFLRVKVPSAGSPPTSSPAAMRAFRRMLGDVLTKFTEPEDLWGPLSLKELR